MPRLPPLPELSWSDDGVPRARSFDDVYFSREGGLAESEAVFVAGCGLPEGWRNRDRFAVCELGFGTGLNVLALWSAWRRSRLPHAILHISTIEAYPLARDDAESALAAFADLEPLSRRLLEHWPVRAYGPQQLWMPDEGLALTVHVGDAERVLAGMEGTFDAWFLDGFAPSRNPAMWTERVVREVARLSAPGARLASFTVAGDVRRALAAAGFAVEKRPGFGAKRERLEARFTSQPAAPRRKTGRPFPFLPSHPKRVAVLGAGIAGAACACALRRRGVETIVLEAGRHAAAAASGNPAGLVAPRLDRGGGATSELFLAAYLYAIATYRRLGAPVFEPIGVEERPQPRGVAALSDLLADPPLPGDWMEARDGAAWHKRAGVLRPRAAIDAMLAGASLMTETSVDALEFAGDGWIVRADGGRAVLKADAVVLACGSALARFEAATFLPITLSRGQIEWGAGDAPSRAITHGSYVAPLDGGILFGATFDDVASDAAPTPDALSRRRNLAALAQVDPGVAASVNEATLTSRASLRATTKDRLPIAGAAPKADEWLRVFAALAHGATVEADPPVHPGLYIIGGLGARGLTLAPLLGERIAAEMFGEPQMLSRAALDAIHPARFLFRKLRQA